MKKLLLIIPSYYPLNMNGGPVIFLHRLMEKISMKKKANITVITSLLVLKKDKYKKLEKFKVNENYNILYEKVSFGFISLKLISRIIFNINKYDHIFVNSFFNLYTLTALIFSKQKVAISPRGQLMYDNFFNKSVYKKKLFLSLINLFKNKIYFIFSSSQELIETQRLSLNNYKYIILPNTSSYSPIRIKDNHFESKHKSKKKIITCITRISKRKNIDLIIEAASILKDNQNYFFEIYGPDFGEKKKLQDLIAKNSLINIKIFDQISTREISDKLQKSYIFLLPSKNENFGNVFLESILHYVPIICLNDSYWCDFINKYNIGKITNMSPNKIVKCINEINSYYLFYKKKDFEIVHKVHDPDIVGDKLLSHFEEFNV